MATQGGFYIRVPLCFLRQPKTKARTLRKNMKNKKKNLMTVESDVEGEDKFDNMVLH